MSYLGLRRLSPKDLPLPGKLIVLLLSVGLVVISQIASAQTVNWSYDGAGRLTCATNGTTAATYAYDPEGNLVSITQSSGGCPAPPQGAQVSEVTASSAGNILTFSDGAPSGLLQAPPASTSKPNPNSTPVSASGFATPSTAKQPQS
jgi:YD repeat-containing protein